MSFTPVRLTTSIITTPVNTQTPHDTDNNTSVSSILLNTDNIIKPKPIHVSAVLVYN